MSSFQSQYGIRLSREIHDMPWKEFRQLLIGIGPDTPLGRIVSIRSEDRKEFLENFSSDQRRIRNEWMPKHAKFIEEHTSKETVRTQLNVIKMGFMSMAGLGGD